MKSVLKAIPARLLSRLIRKPVRSSVVLAIATTCWLSASTVLQAAVTIDSASDTGVIMTSSQNMEGIIPSANPVTILIIHDLYGCLTHPADAADTSVHQITPIPDVSGISLIWSNESRIALNGDTAKSSFSILSTSLNFHVIALSFLSGAALPAGDAFQNDPIPDPLVKGANLPVNNFGYFKNNRTVSRHILAEDCPLAVRSWKWMMNRLQAG